MTFWFDSGHIQPPEQTEIQSPEQARKSKTSAQKKIFHILYNVDNCKSSNNISAVVYNISEVFLHYMWGTVGSNVCKREGIIYIYIYRWFLILCVDLRLFFVCFVMVVHESLVCSEQLNWALFFRKILHVLQILQFSSILCIFEPFPAVTMILRAIFSHWGQLRDSNTTIKKGSNIHWCSRRKHDTLRAGGWKLFEFVDQGKLYLIVLPGNMQIFSVV